MLLSLSLQAQESTALVARSVRTLSIADALPTGCFEQVITDQQGRMWLATCGDAQRNRNIHLIQFDGYAGEVHNLGLEPGSSMLLGGLVNDSVLVGIDISNAKLFLYSVNSGEVQFYQPEDSGYVFYSIQIIQNRPFILAFRGSRHVILEFVNSGFAVRSELDNVGQFETILYIVGLLHRVVTIGNQIWFTGEGDAVYRFDIDEGEVARFETPNGVALTKANMLDWGGKFVVGFGTPGEYSVLTFQDDALKPLSIIPQGALYSTEYDKAKFLHFIYADRAGWLFVNYKDASGRIHADLVNLDGRRYDYSEVLGSLPSNDYGTLSSNDFTSSLYAHSGVLILAEVRKNYGFKAFPTHPSRAMLQLDQNEVLCLTDVAPVMLNLQDNNIEAPDKYERINPNERKNILYDNLHNIWFVKSDTLLSYDHTKGMLKRYPVSDRVDYFTQYKDKILFIINGDLFELTPATGDVIQVNARGGSNRIEGTTNMMQLSGDQAWIATSTGLWYVDLKSGQIDRLPVGGRLDIPLLTCLLDSRGNLWLGSESAGLIQYNLGTSDIKFCGRAQGLSHNTVVNILEDDSRNLWVGTFDGINVLNQNMEVLAKFFTQDGLVYDEGNRWSQLKLRDGRMLFGSEQGFTLIDPAHSIKAFRDNPTLQLYCKSVTYANPSSEHQVTVLNPDINRRTFDLPFDRRNIEFRVGTSDYITSAQTEYQYLIDKPGYQWISIGNEPGIVITNLPTGEYDILIRALSAKGIWSENMVGISVNVAKPFYLKWWFFFLCALPFLGYLVLWAWRVRVERRHLEGEVSKRTAQIAAQTEELRKLDQAKTRIYTNITHEFRTPLTVIRGTSELIEGSDDKRQIIRRNTNRLLNLVNQMLELSKLESGNMVMRLSQLDIVMLIRDIFESFVPIAEDKDVGMHFYALPPDLLMDCDPEIIHRIVGNLLANALKFTPSGGNIYVEVIQPEKDQDRVRISVRDTGIGIAEDQIEQIFNRFHQVDDTITRPGEGTGIGLSLTKELVEFLKGTITVQSNPGSGSKFDVVLPITREASTDLLTGQFQFTDTISSASDTGNSAIAETLSQYDQHPAALVVEDNPDVIHYLVNCLQGNYQLHIAMDGQEGVEKALQVVPDLIISDVMMPVKDGIRLCEEVKQDERTSHIPVILLTARADIASRIEGLQRGADAYLAKPFDKTELLLIARNLIASRKALQGRYLSEVQPPESQDPETRIQDAFVSRLNALIEEHLDDEDYGVLPLSREMKYSRAQIHNKVKALTGMSTSAYIQHKRLIHAKKLLAVGEKNISEVAYAVGFRDPNYFSRVFRKEFGSSPSDFIKTEDID